MKASRLFCFALVLCLALPAFAGRPVTIDDLMKYRNVSRVELSPDGSRAVFIVTQPDFDENVMRSNLYLLGASGAAIQLTNGPRRDEHPRWSPDGKWIAFISDRDAKPPKAGKRQVWVISPDGGEAWQLTRGTQTIVAMEWAPDGKRLAVVVTEAPSDEEEKRTKDRDDAVIVHHDFRGVGASDKMGRIYLVSVPDGKAELLYAGDRHITSISFSQRGDEIAFAAQATPKLADSHHSFIGVMNVGTKQVRVIAGAPFSNAHPQFSPDGSMVAFLGLLPTDLLARRLYVVPVTGGASRRVAADVDEDIQPFDNTGRFQWADDSAALYFSASQGMDQHIYRAALDGKAQQVDGFPIGGARDFAIRNGKVAFVYESPSQGADVYTATLGRGELAATKRTELNPYLADLSLGKTEVVRWKNKKDGMAMEGLLVTPPDYQPGKAYPLLLMIHGGGGRFGTGFVLRQVAYPVHVFASQGYVVFKPNQRGSAGWGAKFRAANVKDWGGADYQDIQDGVDELIARGIADPDRMGVMGWSYGGYMTAWSITQTSRFRAASVGAGVTNLSSMYGTTNFPFWFEWYFGGPPWEARELYVARSPITFVDRIATPTLIQHGTEDPGDPISQGEELYTALRARGIAVEMIRYPRSLHNITEPKLLRDALTRNLEWFDRYVRGNAEAAKWHTPPAAQ